MTAGTATALEADYERPMADLVRSIRTVNSFGSVRFEEEEEEEEDQDLALVGGSSCLGLT